MSSPWLLCPRPNDQAPLRLFCFPYAGGSASIFYPWAEILAPHIEVWAIQLPGRGSRLAEHAFWDLGSLVQALTSAIIPCLTKPFALWGHSLGALIAFELARQLRSQQAAGPAHLFISGCSAPQYPSSRAPIHALPEAAFIGELQRLNGTSQEVLEHPGLMQMLLPALRADFAVCETHMYQVEPPLACPITAFGGWQDQDVSQDQLDGWREQTTEAFRTYMLPGDHFFLHSARLLLLRTLLREIQHLIGSPY